MRKLEEFNSFEFILTIGGHYELNEKYRYNSHDKRYEIEKNDKPKRIKKSRKKRSNAKRGKPRSTKKVEKEDGNN